MKTNAVVAACGNACAARSHAENVTRLVKSAGARSRTGSALTNARGLSIRRAALVTLAERKSRYILAAKVLGKYASGVTTAITQLLYPHKDKCYTMTFDNGKEFAEHEIITIKLDADVYFAHPYHSWERGLNENSNGLLRQYFPKEM